MVLRGRIVTIDHEHEAAQADSGRLPVGGGRQYAVERVRLGHEDVQVLVSYFEGVGSTRTGARVEGRYVETTYPEGLQLHHLEGPLSEDQKRSIREDLIPKGYDRPLDFARDHEFDRSPRNGSPVSEGSGKPDESNSYNRVLDRFTKVS